MEMQEISKEFKKSVLNALRMQLDLYPKSTIKDIYKSFFQDEFGPGHLLEDPGKTRIYFDQELKVMNSQGRINVEPCGAGLKFYRVPMDLIKERCIQADNYFSIFLAGASEFLIPDTENWKKKWDVIVTILKPYKGIIDNFEKDSLAIHEVLDSGHYVMHHSCQYRKAYSPHYRIFSRNCILSLISTL